MILDLLEKEREEKAEASWGNLSVLISMLFFEFAKMLIAHITDHSQHKGFENLRLWSLI